MKPSKTPFDESKLTPAQRKALEIAKVQGAKFGRKLNPTVSVDQSLIGGVKVVVGDEVLDSSVRAKLQQMQIALAS